MPGYFTSGLKAGGRLDYLQRHGSLRLHKLYLSKAQVNLI